MNTEDHQSLMEGIAFLKQAAGIAPIKRREAFNRNAARRLLPCIARLSEDKVDNFWNMIFQPAAEAGASEIIRALPTFNEGLRPRLTSDGWENLVLNLPTGAWLDAEDRGLVFGFNALIALGVHGSARAHAYAAEDFAKAKWRLDGTLNTIVQNWCHIPSAELATGYLRAQLVHFPAEARKLYAECFPKQSPHLRYLQSLLIESHLGLDQTQSIQRLIAFNGAAVSNHDRLTLGMICRDPLQLHQALRPIFQPGGMSADMVGAMLKSRHRPTACAADAI